MPYTTLVVLLMVSTAALGQQFDCESMDINGENTTAQDPHTLPYTLSCVLQGEFVQVQLSASAGSAFTAFMVAIFQDNHRVGTFIRETPAASQRTVGAMRVGDKLDSELVCSGSALVSINRTANTSMTAKWVNTGKIDLTKDLQCRVTVVESAAGRRWVGVTKQVETTPVISADEAKSAAVVYNPPPPPQQQDRNLGKLTVEGKEFEDHCDDGNFQYVPPYDLDCKSYITSKDGKARAYLNCDGSGLSLMSVLGGAQGGNNCFDAHTCQCRSCSDVQCPTSEKSHNLVLNVRNNRGKITGIVAIQQSDNPKGYNDNTHITGDINPNGLKGLQTTQHHTALTAEVRVQSPSDSPSKGPGARAGSRSQAGENTSRRKGSKPKNKSQKSKKSRQNPQRVGDIINNLGISDYLSNAGRMDYTHYVPGIERSSGQGNSKGNRRQSAEPNNYIDMISNLFS